MASGESGIRFRQIRTVLNEGRIGALADEQLLDQWATRGGEAAEAAFETLVLRHGPMVLGVCKRLLRDSHEIEDAFQATFLILARRAGSIRNREVLGGWLCKVAYRVAAPARTLSRRHRSPELPDTSSPFDRPDEIVEQDDLRIAILDEVHRLPQKYRLAVQLCYLEGRTHDEAARQLDWPVGTVRTRLAWARDRLRDRLVRRGLALPAGLIGAALVSAKASAKVPDALVKATIAAAAGRSVGMAVTTLTDIVLRAMFMSKLKLAIFLCLATGTLAGIAIPISQAQVGKPGPAQKPEGPQPTGPQTEVPQEPATAREVGTVFVRVVDQKTKQPLAGVVLKVWVNGKVTRQHTTDDSGRMVLRLPQTEFATLSVTAQRDGLVPMRINLRQFGSKDTEIPRFYTLAMERGTSIGGIVRDEEDQPIEGVTVSLHLNAPKDRGHATPDLNGITTRSDRQGRWHIDLIPAGLDLGHLGFTLTHPEFVSRFDASNVQSSMTPDPLRQRNAVIVLRRGIPVAGRVVNRDGGPIVGASIQLSDRHRFSDPWNSTVRTDAQGRFRITNAVARQSVLIVQAAGYAPEMRSVDVRPGVAPVEFRLGPGRTVQGKVIDSRAQPIARATVAVSEWRGGRILDWLTHTDESGRFRWDDAPSDAVSLNAFKEGYDVATMNVEPSVKDPVFTLRPSSVLRIRGTVTDVETGQPIETFTVVPGLGPGRIWLESLARTHHGGRYVFSDVVNAQPYLVRIEAKGYLPATSPAYPNNAGEKTFNARLSKGAWLEGVVRGTHGEPLAGAEVIVATDNGVHISGGKTYQREYHLHLLTGPDGRFSFSPPDGPYRLIALHDQGYAESSASSWPKCLT